MTYYILIINEVVDIHHLKLHHLTPSHSSSLLLLTPPPHHRVETYRDVTSVPTFFVRKLGKLLDACI
jgi:hypothetical protein